MKRDPITVNPADVYAYFDICFREFAQSSGELARRALSQLSGRAGVMYMIGLLDKEEYWSVVEAAGSVYEQIKAEDDRRLADMVKGGDLWI